MTKFWIFLIRIYQQTLSPIIGRNCRFTPSCSEYTIEAIKEYGSFKGWIMGVKRILRCNPFCKGGYDPVLKRKNEEE